jgi:hypothetical protein
VKRKNRGWPRRTVDAVQKATSAARSVPEVFILRQILPYDYDNPIVGVFTSLEGAQGARREEVKVWHQNPMYPDVWTSVLLDGGTTDPYYAIERFTVRTR